MTHSWMFVLVLGGLLALGCPTGEDDDASDDDDGADDDIGDDDVGDDDVGDDDVGDDDGGDDDVGDDDGGDDDTAGPEPSRCELGPQLGDDVQYVTVSGSDDSGDGSQGNPWATITQALDHAPDGSLILVGPGLYEGNVRLRGTFPAGVSVCADPPYQAQLRHGDTVVTAYTHVSGCEGITLEGFDIAHSGPGAGALVVHLDAGGDGAVQHITLRNNVIHDSYDNDVLKINHGIHDVLVEGNLLFNQTGSDEHIDLNSAESVVIRGNIFLNDFAASGRTNGNDTSSYIVIKDSNQDGDIYTGSHDVTVEGNVFLHYEGSTGTVFLLLGEDGHPIHETYDILVQNNLMLGDSDNPMRAPFGVKGGRDIVFRNNTVVGDLPARAFAMRLNVEGSNPANENIEFYNNVWSDPTGTMGALDPNDGDDFSDTDPAHTLSFVLSHNLYFNGGDPIPNDAAELINPDDDPVPSYGDPELGAQAGLVPPHFDSATHTFADGSTTIREAFEHLVLTYGAIGATSVALDGADPAHAPATDILGLPRDATPDLGAYEWP